MADLANPTAQQALDILLYEDVNGIRTKKLIIDLRKLAENSEWAEDFLEKGGIDALLKLAKNTSGSVQGIILQAVRSFMVYINALDRFADSPELVDRMFALLYPPEPNAPVNLTVAKAALELLVVICGKLENGHQLINDAAKKKTGVDTQPYANFAALLTSNDLNCVWSTLLLMNLLVTKRKAADDLKAKRLVFRWKQAGLFALLEPLAALEDEKVQKQLSALQKSTDYTIPRSWVEAHKYKTQYMDVKRRLDSANEQLFVLQQQQAKVRLMKLEFARAQTTLRALGAIMPTLDTTPHPTKRYADGGGISLQQLRSPETETVDLDAVATKETTDLRKKLMETLLKQPDFASIAEGIMGPRGGPAGRRAGGPALGFDDDFPPPPSDDDDEDGDLLPPPDDNETEEDLPPPDDDNDGPSVGPKTTPGASSGNQQAGTSPQHRDPNDSSSAFTSSGPSGSTVNLDGTTNQQGQDSNAASSPLVSSPDSATLPQLGEQVVSAAAAGTRAAPPPPPPPPKKGGPPPPPPVKGAMGAGPAKAAERQWYKGPAPAKKMRPLHWDKWGLDAAQEKDSLWGRIHSGDVTCDFDFEEFEAMFCQKEVEAKAPKEKKPEKVLLVDSKTYQNLSIMLHKLPTIPTIQNALLTLDSDTLEPQMILAMIDQKLLTPEVYKLFGQKQNEKRVEEYEPPEQFVAMTLSVPEFRRRCTAWLFTMEWGGNIASALKPIHRMNAAMSAVVNSQHLPYFMGLLLGFGNVMNYGNASKGNAPAMAISVLSKIEASKDNRGKVSLLQHMLDTARARNPEALELHEELKPLFDNILSLKIDDLEKSVSEAEKQLATFVRDCQVVRKALDEAGTASEDPFIPYTAEFNIRATEELDKIKVAYAETQRLSLAMQKYLGVPEKKPMKPEEIFAELYPFVDKVRAAAADAAKEKKRLARKGQKLDSDIGNVLGALQSEIVSAH